MADLPTAYWNLLANQFASVGPRDYGQLRQIHAGGEAMPLKAWPPGTRRPGPCAPAQHLRADGNHGHPHPLDCTPYVAGRTTRAHTLADRTALPGRDIYLLDDAGQPVPTGVVGELVIGGAIAGARYFGRSAR
ncbi:hypothetical protein GTA07_29575 [Rhodococcus hoagii]|nr:hypothetical protein [Prescottella equi]